MPSIREKALSTFVREPDRRRWGTACLRAILRCHTSRVSACWIRILDKADLALTTLLDLHRVAGAAGFRSHGFRTDLTHLKEHEGPCILHAVPDDGLARFFVCYGYENRRYVVGDPAKGIRSYPALTLSRFWPSRAVLVLEPVTESSVESAPRYRCLNAAAVSFGEAHVYIRSRRNGRRHVISAPLAQRVFSAPQFQPLAAYTSTGSTKAEDSADTCLREALTLVRDGLLVSEEEVRAELISSARSGDSEERVSIEAIGVPTCNRSDSLDRALRSYADNLLAAGRQATFTIADDSQPQAALRNRERLAMLRRDYPFQFHYADRSARRTLAGIIARDADLPPAVVNFALLGAPRLGPTYGASRNYLLLSATGEPSLQVDDDTICGDLVFDYDRRITLSAALDPNHYWFGEPSASGNDILHLVSYRRRAVDFAGLHEQLLGRKVKGLLAEASLEGAPLDVGEMDADLFSCAAAPEAAVAVTFAGSIGDAGSRGVLPRMLLRGSSLERLVASRSSYERGKNTRWLLRVVPERVIGNSILCMTVNIGLDHRRLLPPFMPVGRTEDGVFGSVLRVCFAAALKGYLPGFALYHRPPEDRGRDLAGVCFRGYRANELLIQLILSSASSRSGRAVRGMRELGRRLLEVSSLPQPEFDEYVSAVAERSAGVELGIVQRAAVERRDVDCGLADDLQKYAVSLEAALLGRDAFWPTDLPGAVDEQRAALRQLVREYGELLIFWPAIVDSARRLRASERWRADSRRTASNHHIH